MTQNAANQDYTNNSDGFTIGGGTTERKLTLTGANITLTGSGSNTYTYPAASDTLVGRASTDTLTNKTINASQLVNTTVTADKLNLAPSTGYTATDESTTSATYVAPTTATNATITVGANGLALVMWSAGLYGAATIQRLSVAVSGASTVAANDNWSMRSDVATFQNISGISHLFTGLNPGSTTFSLQFKTASGTTHIFERSITAIPL